MAHADDGYRLVHTFAGAPGGLYPGSLVGHQTGGPETWALYGMTLEGGVTNKADCGPLGGCGIVFKLSPPPPGSTHWTETRLYVFAGGADGESPAGRLTFDASGAAYGTAAITGGCGIAFRLTPPLPGQYFWNKSVLHYFTCQGYAGQPVSGLIPDGSGAVYGASPNGGAFGYGVVFKLTPPAAGTGLWTETVLHDFSMSDGIYPKGSPVFDGSGALYGTTSSGFDYPGSVFRLVPPASGHAGWSFTTLYNFPSVAGGLTNATNALVRDASEVLYGTALNGPSFDGAVFSLTPPTAGQTAWTPAILHAFSGADGANPGSLAIFDNSGALYGVTDRQIIESGPFQAIVGGVVYKLTPPGVGQTAWNETILHALGEPINPAINPATGALVRDAFGTLYSTSFIGGASDVGTAFKILQ